MSDIPKETVGKVLSALDIRAVLEYLDYRVDTIQESDKAIRCFCPVHKEQVFRTLTIEKSDKKAKCAFTSCPARKSTDLIELTALVKQIEKDEALLELVQRFAIDVKIPSMGAMLEKRLQSAQESLTAGALEDAYNGFRYVLSLESENLPALNGLIRVCEKQNKTEELAALQKRMAAFHFQQQDFETAVQILEQYLQHTPADVEIRLRVAECHHRLGRQEAMIAEMVRIAKLFESTNETDKALEIYHRIDTLKPGTADVNDAVVDLLVKVGRADEAIAQIAERANQARLAGNVDEALVCYRQILQIDPQRDDFRTHFIEAALAAMPQDGADTSLIDQCLELLDGFDTLAGAPLALNALEKMRERYPNHIPVLERLYKQYRAQGQNAQAEGLQEDLARVYVLAGEDSLAAQDPDNAFQAFQRAAELQENNAEAVRGMLRVSETQNNQEQIPALQKRLAMLYADQERHEEAIPVFEAYLQTSPDDMNSRLQLVSSLHAVGRGSEMITELKNVARAYAKAKKIDNAIEIYKRISSLDVEDEEVHAVLIKLLVKAGRTEEAAQHVLELADQHRMEGRTDAALACYRQILDLNPERDDARLKYLQTLAAAPDLKTENLDECLALVGGFVQEEWSNMALQILEDLRARFPGNPLILEKIYQVYRIKDRHNDADALAFDLAQNFMDAEDYPAALKWIESLIVPGNPGRPIALSLKANICKAMGDIPSAVSALMEVIRDHEAQGRKEDTLPFYESILEIQPENLDAQHHRILALAALQMNEEIIQTGEQITALLVESPQTETALEILRELVKCAPLHTRFLMTLASVLTRQGREDEARRTLIKATDLFAEQQRHGDAIEILEYLTKRDPHDLAVIERLADFRLQDGQEKEALEGYQSLADLYAEQGAQDAQLDVLLKISEIKPDETEVHKKILALYDELGNTRDAKELRGKMIRIYMAQKAWKEALDLCRETLAADPHDILSLEMCLRIHENMGRPDAMREDALVLLEAYRAAGDLEQAAKLTDTLVSEFPGDPKIIELRITTLCETAGWNTAIATLDRLVKIHRDAGTLAESLRVMRDMIGSSGAPADRLLPIWFQICRETGALIENWAGTLHLINALESTSHITLAADTLDTFLEEQPAFETARARLVELLKKAGLQDRAIEALREWARISLESDDIESANRHYEHALEIAPDNLELQNEILHFRITTGIRKGAADLASRVASRLEHDGLVGQAIHVLEMGLKAEPRRNDLRKRILALEDLTADPERLRKHYSETFASQLERREYEAARALITETIGRFPTDLPPRLQLADLLKKMSLEEDALVELTNIASIQMEMGDLTACLQMLGNILDAEPGHQRAQAMQTEVKKRLESDKVALQEFRKVVQSIQGASPETIIEMLRTRDTVATQSLEMLPILKEYTFSNFIVGTRNNFAQATAMAVAKTPGGDYNPLFLYGDVGLGKTHLLHAIANDITKNHPEMRLLYTSSEEFTNALIEAIQNNTVREFRAIHKSPDIFLIDDVHALAEKERAQEEFFQIFNTLYQANKQIVMTSDRPPKEILHLERRLRSRFGAGIIIDIQPPDFETRVAILRYHLNETETVLPDDMITLIAQTVESNIRELKSVLTQILARIRLTNEKPSPEIIGMVLEQIRHA